MPSLLYITARRDFAGKFCDYLFGFAARWMWNNFMQQGTKIKQLNGKEFNGLKNVKEAMQERAELPLRVYYAAL